MTANVGTLDRIARAILGIILVLAPFISGMAMFANPVWTTVSVLVGIVLLGTSAIKFCPAYRLLGMQTCKM
ncbi:MAG: DUF2892 domain-containing protein [Rhodobacteraceae bacterium]|nr:DUF2892 domain-containing protein [Paracoccaceae bacterium]